MLDKLDFTENKYEELSIKISDPSVMANQNEWRKLCKEHAELETIVTKYREYKNNKEELEANKELLSEENDRDMKEMIQEEIKTLEESIVRDEEELKILLLPKDPNDDKNVFVEIRAGAGGDEAALFASELARMYTKYAERQRWKVEVMDASHTGVGGLKDVILFVQGRGAWSRLKFERGVHRVQRVPVTEASGRIHTSTVTVAVLPEAEDVDVKVDERDLRVDVYRSSGPGGQGVNTTDSAVRITHLPTGIVVSCQNERSQLQNKASAMMVLQAKLLERRRQEEQARMDALKDTGSSWGNQMRSYVLHPYQMVKDLRTDVETGNPANVLDGDIDAFIEAGIRWRRQQENAELN